MVSKGRLRLPVNNRRPLLKSLAHGKDTTSPSTVKTHPNGSKGDENASVLFIGTATTIIEWEGIRVLTDPNFLHAGDHVHLGPGVTAERLTNPAIDLSDLPPLDAILLSHYHEDHFDKLVEESLNRDFLIISTPHANECLSSKPDPFRNIVSLDFFDHVELAMEERKNEPAEPVINVTGMPGKHVPPGPLAAVNELLKAIPPTNGWMLEFGYRDGGEASEVRVGYRIYITGDTLFVDELKDIPKWLQSERIDMMLIHLGGTTVPSPSMPLFMVTMDAKQGLDMMKLMDPEVSVPIHYDDYDAFASPLSDFKKVVEEAGMQDRVIYLDRGEKYRFTVKD
ncbi:beta-lactamase-like protein [Thelonectria olida]|uniref:Beta-lactamase-like protein n=1 Tax=Thelonectria olida TaxID=1576542 RepID=A0A9P9AIH4_9HYPO|nr:beta-lactamase-like protein [Thelonectria olida]